MVVVLVEEGAGGELEGAGGELVGCADLSCWRCLKMASNKARILYPRKNEIWRTHGKYMVKFCRDIFGSSN